MGGKEMHYPCNVFRGHGIAVHFLLEEMADETVHVLVGTASPRGVGMGKEEVCAESLGDSRMLG